MSLIFAIILLGMLIFVHELGHFLFAKMAGVTVEKFALGFGPKLIGKKVGDTEYLICALPLGGYVKMLGEDPEEGEEIRELSDEEKKRAYAFQPIWKRAFIIVMGPFFNLSFAALVLVGIYLAGVPVLLAEIGEVKEGTPAHKASLMPGDRIIEVDGVAIDQWSTMTDVIYENPGREMLFKVQRGDMVLDKYITPEAKVVQNIFGEDREVGQIGISSAGTTVTQSYGIFDSVRLGLEKAYEMIELTLMAFVKLIQNIIPASTLGGPILIVQMAGKSASQGPMSFMTLTALISINLGVINLFPIPILDGGHLLFLFIEAIRKKPLSEKVMIVSQKVGLAFLLSLMVFVFYNDIVRIVNGTGF